MDVGMFFAVLAPLCAGPTDKRKCLVFDVLKWHISHARKGIILYTDAKSYTSIYVPFIFQIRYVFYRLLETSIHSALCLLENGQHLKSFM